MKILIIFKKTNNTCNEVSEFKRKLVAVPATVHILTTFSDDRTSDLEVVITSQDPSQTLDVEQQKLLAHSDFAVTHFRNISGDSTFKIIKDCRKNVVRDVDIAALFFTLGRYFEIDYAEYDTTKYIRN